MNYPKYIPKPIKDYFNRLLENNSYQLPFEYKNKIEKLVTDSRMKDVYQQHKNELSEEQLKHIIQISWSCPTEGYDDHRQSRIQGKKSLRKITTTLKKLKLQLEELEKASITETIPLFCINDIIMHTFNQQDYLWQHYRKEVLKNDGWSCAPSTTSVIEAMISLAKNAIEGLEKKPDPTSHFNAAIATRQHDQKSEFLRSFFYLVIFEHKIPLSEILIEKISIIATVIIGDENTDITKKDCETAIEGILKNYQATSS